MPARLFDGRRFRLARQAADLKQIDVALGAGLRSHFPVSSWETGDAKPDPDKLPVLASVVGRDLDDLFPRQGDPDLADLRCDAGLSQQAAADALGTSRAPIGKAERGRRRLAPEYEAPLAAAYGVDVAMLRRAQERSFGNPVPEPAAAEDSASSTSALPRTIAEKINYLLEHTYTQHTAPSDDEIARQGNEKTGLSVLDTDLVRDLRSGARTQADEDALDALAAALDVPPVFFRSNDAAVHRIVSGVRLVTGGLRGVAARGETEALPTELLDFINAAVEEIKATDFPQHPSSY
ncbi:helix-turn-helix domain-containing protein [Streptomyces albus]|uniref:helix-turn-helix domain-containing protein n=1 Tax=Streptomyces albus TaxID=1888 RepID=UPI003F199C77